MQRAVELETIARQYFHALQIGGMVLLSDAEIAAVVKGFASYGVQDRKAGAERGTSEKARRLRASRGSMV
jgi:L-fuculose-phosphate aldolase